MEAVQDVEGTQVRANILLLSSILPFLKFEVARKNPLP